MGQRVSDIQYNLIADIGLPIRNIFLNPKKMLKEVTVLPGEKILDYGCGPGAFTFPLADVVGERGIVYALDVHPLALRRIERGQRGHTRVHVRTILSDCATSLPDAELDRIILFDVFHLLDNPQAVLRELHRVLKPHGILYVNDHHMKESDILDRVSISGLFVFRKRCGDTYQWKKA
jgi:ubiquinone/menaquinone biosynthesis C-methylase UbiE